MPGVGGDALSYGAGMHSSLPSLSITSAFVSQPPEKTAEGLKGLEDPQWVLWFTSRGAEHMTVA